MWWWKSDWWLVIDIPSVGWGELVESWEEDVFLPPTKSRGKEEKVREIQNARNTLKLIGYCLLFFHDIYGKDAIAIEFCVVSREDHLDLYFTALYVQVKP